MTLPSISSISNTHPILQDIGNRFCQSTLLDLACSQYSHFFPNFPGAFPLYNNISATKYLQEKIIAAALSSISDTLIQKSFDSIHTWAKSKEIKIYDVNVLNEVVIIVQCLFHNIVPYMISFCISYQMGVPYFTVKSIIRFALPWATLEYLAHANKRIERYASKECVLKAIQTWGRTDPISKAVLNLTLDDEKELSVEIPYNEELSKAKNALKESQPTKLVDLFYLQELCKKVEEQIIENRKIQNNYTSRSFINFTEKALNEIPVYIQYLASLFEHSREDNRSSLVAFLVEIKWGLKKATKENQEEVLFESLQALYCLEIAYYNSLQQSDQETYSFFSWVSKLNKEPNSSS